MNRIIESKCIHNGKELPCYVPQVSKDGEWIDVLSKGSYILKEGHNPLRPCKCNYQGCGECKGSGFRKGETVDLRYVAEIFLSKGR